MMYAILCFSPEELLSETWSNEEDDAIMARLDAVQASFAGRIIGSARLLPSTSAVSVRKGRLESLVIDGPFIESKEQFAGYYLVECEGLDQVVAFAEDLVRANPWGSGYEIRPIRSLAGEQSAG